MLATGKRVIAIGRAFSSLTSLNAARSRTTREQNTNQKTRILL